MNHALIANALDFATKAHEGQTRKYSGLPYIMHCIDVLQLLTQRVPEATDDMFVAAVLHDVVEDTVVPLSVIEENFGERVAQLVDMLTHKEDRSENRATRKEKEAQRLATIDADAQTIKYCDIICNLRDLEQQDPGFAKVYKAEKQQAIMLMADGKESLRQEAWLATVTPMAPGAQTYANFTGVVSREEAEAMVGG